MNNWSSASHAIEPPGEDRNELARSVEQLITNVTTQTKINDAIVTRLLALERKIAELADARQRENGIGRAPAVPSGLSMPTMSMPSVASSTVATAAAATASPTAALTKDPLPMYLGNSLALCRVMNSFPMYVDTRDTYITPQILLAGNWEPAETQLVLRLIRPGMTVVDVGANYGYFTLLAAAGVGPAGHVCAFEPESRNLEILDRNLQLNGYFDRVKVFPNAVLDKVQKVDLHRNRRNFGNHTLFVTDRQNSDYEKINVDAVTLDDTVQGAADFIKIDAEGSEPLIFRGMRGLMARSPRLTILTEFNLEALQAGGFTPREFLRELEGYGYALNAVSAQSTWAAANHEILLQQPISTLLLTRKAM